MGIDMGIYSFHRITEEPRFQDGSDLDMNRAASQPEVYDMSTTAASRSQMKGGVQTLLLAFFIIVLPMLILPITLLGLILKNQIIQNPNVSGDLIQGLQLMSDSSVYFVKCSATVLVTLTSWLSSFATMLSSYVVVLCSFPAAYRLMQKSLSNETHELPTPEQLSLYLNLQKGSIMAIRDWINYSRDPSQARLVPAVRFMLWGFGIASLLGGLIIAADTWIHVATATVSFISLVPMGSVIGSYGRSWTPNCLDTNFTSDINNTCLLMNDGTNTILANVSEAYQTINNLSSTNAIISFRQNQITYFMMADTQLPDNIDFQAVTIGIASQCRMATNMCNMQSSSESDLSYNCSRAFAGNALNATSALNRTYFESADLQQPLQPDAKPGPSPYAMNPFFSAELYMSSQIVLSESGLGNSDEIISLDNGGLAWILQCQTTVYDIVYTWINGTIKATDVTETNATMARVFLDPMYPMQKRFPLVDLTSAAQSASLLNSTDELQERYAISLARETLGLGVGSMTPRNAIQTQTRNATLVARIPKAPLYVLVVLCLFYAALSIALVLVGFWSDPKGTQDVQSRLSVEGLTAAYCEDQEWAERCGQNHSNEGVKEKAPSGLVRRVKLAPTTLGGYTYEVLK